MHLRLENPVIPTTLHWGFHIRGLNIKKELHLWAQIQNEVFADDPNYEPVDVESLLALTKRVNFDPNLILVCLFNDRPVGFCSGWSANSVDGGKKVQIQGMGIIENYRRRGYAKAMLFELLNRAYLKGYKSFELVVQSTNNAALNMYESTGFTEKYRYIWFKKKY